MLFSGPTPRETAPASCSRRLESPRPRTAREGESARSAREPMKAESISIHVIEAIEPDRCGDLRCCFRGGDGARRHGGIARDGKVET